MFLLIIAEAACSRQVEIVPVERSLNGTVWKKFEYCQGNRDISKVLTFRAPDIIKVAVRDDYGYLINETQAEYRNLNDYSVFTVDGPFVEDFRGRFLAEDQIEFQGGVLVKYCR